MLPRRMRQKLDVLGNVTNILQTQNLEDAELNLNREITRLKFNSESLISQRTIMNNQIASMEDIEKVYQQELKGPNKNKVAPAFEDNSKFQNSEMFLNNPEERIAGSNYKDSTLIMSNDLTIGMNEGPSRNIDNTDLKVNPSTRDKFDHQTHSSVNQFSMSNNRRLVKHLDASKKPQKMEKNLYEEYKHPNVIEEENKNATIDDIPKDVFKSFSEEESKEEQMVRPNAIISNEIM